MRLWTIHPKYLDFIWLVSCWREWLLAKKVLQNKTIWYKNHPQLDRFKNYKHPIVAIDAYLYQIYLEAKNRWYKFNESKIKFINSEKIIWVSNNQVNYEFNHLLSKLKIRSPVLYKKHLNLKKISINPIFFEYIWEIETWEKI